jgi:hypothetical protein
MKRCSMKRKSSICGIRDLLGCGRIRRHGVLSGKKDEVSSLAAADERGDNTLPAFLDRFRDVGFRADRLQLDGLKTVARYCPMATKVLA